MSVVILPDSARSGRLDGLTILRFAHAFESGGGVERHLAELNPALAARSRMTTIEMRLTQDPENLAETEQRLGKSRLITVPLLVESGPINDWKLSADSSRLQSLQQQALNMMLPTPGMNCLAMRPVSRWRSVPRRAAEPDNAGAKAAELMRRFQVDLVVLHASGGADASEIQRSAQSARIPVAIVHHFANSRLGGLSLRQQIAQAAAIGGASAVGVPAYLRRVFWNLSDAVDTDFYRRDRARPVPLPAATRPILYAPARLTPEKGQTDVIEVAALLVQRGFSPTIVFAGRQDSPEFERHLRALAGKRGLAESVVFLGPLSPDVYRDWYRVADFMVLPTRHGEGMPRTLIESQAMEVPPIVYDIGGTREGVRHGESGFVVPVGDVAAMAQAMESMLRAPTRHRAIGKAGRRFVEQHFSFDAFAARHEDFYRGALNHARAPHALLRPLAAPVHTAF